MTNRLFGWASAINNVIRGDRPKRPSLILGPTPDLLQRYGLGSGSITMSVDKIGRYRREHPEVPLQIWYDLPELLSDPLAIFPSARRDGSIVILLLVEDRDKNPVLVVATTGQAKMNVILSVYGKEQGFAWAAKELNFAISDGYEVYQRKDFAATLPQPPVTNATSSSHGLIPIDGAAKPRRLILKLTKKSTKS